MHQCELGFPMLNSNGSLPKTQKEVQYSLLTIEVDVRRERNTVWFTFGDQNVPKVCFI